MSLKLTGKNGVLRLYSSYRITAGGSVAGGTSKIVKYDGAYTDISANVKTDNTAYSTVLEDNTDAVYLGCTRLFSYCQYLKSAGTNYGAGTGALICYYFDGTDFSNEVTSLEDTTVSGGDTFAQDGEFSFKIPKDWTTGANIIDSELTSTYYWIKIMTTTSASTAPDADLLSPMIHQHIEVPFINMDFTGPIGRPLTEEKLILDRGRMEMWYVGDGYRPHYIELIDDKIYEPMPISFTCSIDSTWNDETLFLALEGGDADSGWAGSPGIWVETPTTTKGTTKNDGTNYNPAFADTNKKCINLQIIWTSSLAVSSHFHQEGAPATSIGYAYYEVFFPKELQKITEGDDAITLSCEGGVYGIIERIYGFGMRYDHYMLS